MKNERILRVKGLSKYFDHKAGSLTVFEELNFEVMRGDVVCFVGPSGCGKSTLLRCVAGLVPFQGAISIAGRVPQTALKDKEIGFAFQEAGLITWKTVYENILLPSEIGRQKLAGGEARDKVEALLKMTGLTDFRDFYPDELSGGMRQRAALARALLLQPKLLLLDEPFSSLDSLTRLNLMVEFKTMLSETQTTALLITHNIQEAAYLADHIYILSKLPATIVDHIEVNYRHARNIDLLDKAEFTNVMSECRKKLFDYAL